MFATTADVAALRAPAHAPVARRGAVAIVAKESRIGKAPVRVPKGVTVKIEGNTVMAKVRLTPARPCACHGLPRLWASAALLFASERVVAACPASARPRLARATAASGAVSL